jgi:hypothetical protein
MLQGVAGRMKRVNAFMDDDHANMAEKQAWVPSPRIEHQSVDEPLLWWLSQLSRAAVASVPLVHSVFTFTPFHLLRILGLPLIFIHHPDPAVEVGAECAKLDASSIVSYNLNYKVISKVDNVVKRRMYVTKGYHYQVSKLQLRFKSLGSPLFSRFLHGHIQRECYRTFAGWTRQWMPQWAFPGFEPELDHADWVMIPYTTSTNIIGMSRNGWEALWLPKIGCVGAVY